MGKLEDAVREEIVRLARRELRNAVVPLAKEVRELRRAVAQLGKTGGSAQRGAAPARAQAEPEPGRLTASAGEVEKSRFSAALIQKLRKRLALSQSQLAALVGVSGPAVAQWESGRSMPRGANRAALVGLRKLGKREVKRMVEALPGAKGDAGATAEQTKAKKAKKKGRARAKERAQAGGGL